MKFRLFGGLDCPDAVLAQLSIASVLPLAAVGKLVDFITNTILSEPHGNMFEGAQSLLTDTELLTGAAEAIIALQGSAEKAAAAAPPTPEQCTAALTKALCALHSVITAAVRYGIDISTTTTSSTATNTAASATADGSGASSSVFVQELLMLGFSAEMTEVIRSGTEPYTGSLRAAMLKNTPRVARLENVSVTTCKKQEGMLYVEGAEGEGKRKIAMALVENGAEVDSIVLSADVVRPHLIGESTARRPLVMEMSTTKAKVLLAELVVARNRLRMIQSQQQ